MTRCIQLSAPQLSYSRKLDLKANINSSTTARFRVLINGTVFQEKAVTFANYADTAWQRFDNLDLAAYANQTVTLRFEASANANVCLEAWAKARIDDIRVGNASEAADVTAPSVNLTAPANGATLAGNVDLTATASDAVGVTKVEFYAGGSLLGVDLTAPYAWTWNTTEVANGGYAFKQKADGSYDPNDTGVNNEGAIKGVSLLNKLLREKYMPEGSGYAEMEGAMAQGKVAMMINGPWSWVNLKRVGIDFGVARIPSVAGKPAAPYVGIKGMVINRATPMRELAVEFIEQHVLQPDGLRAIDRAETIGAPASKRYFAELSSDARIQGIMDSAKDGVPTPSIPEMSRFWAAMKSSLTNLSEGRQTPRQALDLLYRLKSLT